jgi:hypothetical protein
MRCPAWFVVWLSLGACAFGAGPVTAQVLPVGKIVSPDSDERADLPRIRAVPSASLVPLDDVPGKLRKQVREVIEQPTIAASGPVEEFPARMPGYCWLIEHPDRAAVAWRRLGTPCLNITDRGNGRFGWADSQGSDITWQIVSGSPQIHIWYAEGKVRPALLLPLVSVRAVVLLHHQEHFDWLGRPRIVHHADIFAQTDSKTASLVLRLFGPSVPRLTEQALGQLTLFFSGLARYLHHHPDRVEEVLLPTDAGEN